jgi:hypothetical protein
MWEDLKAIAIAAAGIGVGILFGAFLLFLTGLHL